MPSINEKILDVPVVYTKELTEGIKDDKSVVNLARGDSEFQTPRPVIEYLCRILPEVGDGLEDFNTPAGKWTHYEKGKGSKRLRQAIARKYKRESGLDIDENCILVTQGGMNAIYTAFLAVASPGDEIMIPDPCYVAYDPIANYVIPGIHGKRIKLAEKNGFLLTVEQLDAAKTDRTKAVILTSPLNPTGSLYDSRTLQQIMEWGICNDIFIIHDENHEKEIYDGNIHYPIRMYDPPGEHTILLNSLSRLGMGGWRLGWIIAPERVIRTAAMAHSYINMTCNTFVQEAGAFTLDHYGELGFDGIFREYAEKRNLLVAALNGMDGIHCQMPKSTCYAFPNIRAFYDKNRERITSAAEKALKRKTFLGEADMIQKSVSYAMYKFLLIEAGVGVIPGIAYGPDSDDYVRFSFSVKRDAVVEGIRRLKAMCDVL